MYIYNSADIAGRITLAHSKKYGNKKQLRAKLIECGAGEYAVANLKKGSMISADKLAMIADALDCSVDYLLGRSDRVSTDLPSEESDAPQISAYEQRMLDACRELSIEDKMYFLGRVEEAARQEQKKEA